MEQLVLQENREVLENLAHLVSLVFPELRVIWAQKVQKEALVFRVLVVS